MPTMNSIGSNIPIEISKGGTNATSFATSNGILKYDGTSLVTDAYNTIDAGNRWLKSSQPAFYSWKVTDAGSVSGDGTIYHPILFDGVLFNNSSSYNPSTGIFTAPKAGIYNFMAGATSDSSNNHSNITLYFYKNGSIVVKQQIVVVTSGWAGRSPNRSVEISLAAADTVYAGWSSAGDAANTSWIFADTYRMASFFSGYLVC